MVSLEFSGALLELLRAAPLELLRAIMEHNDDIIEETPLLNSGTLEHE